MNNTTIQPFKIVDVQDYIKKPFFFNAVQFHLKLLVFIQLPENRLLEKVVSLKNEIVTFHISNYVYSV